MIGVTAFARFAGLAGLPALLPAFAKAAWLNIAPEYNPYKYNSFPVNGASVVAVDEGAAGADWPRCTKTTRWIGCRRYWPFSR